MNYIAYNGIYYERSQIKMANEGFDELRKEQKDVRERRSITQVGSEEYFRLLEIDERLQKQIDKTLQADLDERNQTLAEEKLRLELEENDIQRKHEKRGRIWDAVVRVGTTILMIGGSVLVAFLGDALENPGNPTDPKLGRTLKEAGKTMRQRIIK